MSINRDCTTIHEIRCTIGSNSAAVAASLQVPQVCEAQGSPGALKGGPNGALQQLLCGGPVCGDVAATLLR